MDCDYLINICQRIQAFVDALPVLPANSVPKDETCPICLNPFSLIISGDEQSVNMDQANFAITKLSTCGHMFCRKDISEWIRSYHGSCPTCRCPFLEIRVINDSDGESSDGDYVPNDDDEDEEDVFTDQEFFDEFEVDGMDVDLADEWGDVEEEIDGGDNWGYSDDFAEPGSSAMYEEDVRLWHPDPPPAVNDEDFDRTLCDSEEPEPK